MEAFCKPTSENNHCLLGTPLRFLTCLLLSHSEERAEHGDCRPWIVTAGNKRMFYHSDYYLTKLSNKSVYSFIHHPVDFQEGQREYVFRNPSSTDFERSQIMLEEGLWTCSPSFWVTSSLSSFQYLLFILWIDYIFSPVMKSSHTLFILSWISFSKILFVLQVSIQILFV